MSERRRFKRFDISLDVEFKVSNGSDASFSGVTKNFSRSGLCFESDCFDPALKDFMDLKVKLPGKQAFSFVRGNVAWKEQIKDKCYFGLEFLEMDAEDKSHILDQAYDQWVEDSRNMPLK
jgi:c-di-GMP-binding flagellar brake protein YcgR